MNALSKFAARWIVIGLCAFAAVRVFVFAAAFPFFNNVDEQAHVDLVLKYAHGDWPRSIEPFSPQASSYLALYRTPEYFVPPQEYGGNYPPPNWAVPAEDRHQVETQEASSWESRTNHESGEPPLYYALAGVWYDIGRTLGLGELASLYWIRFLNVLVAAAVAWIGYQAALLVFGEDEFIAIATAMLLAVWPQSSFYSIQGDSLAAVTFGFAFFAALKLLKAEQPTIALGISAGLAVAATCLIKTANLPLIFIVLAAVVIKTADLARRGRIAQGCLLLGAYLISIFVPLGIWFARNQRYFGDITATKSKIDLLGWTGKAFSDWWSHPIFTPAGAGRFWTELMASFWRGEFIWHGERMATFGSDAFYCASSTIALLMTIAFLLIRRRSVANRTALWLAVLSFAALVGFLVLLSIRFDFGDCPYPSREHPYFTSGRLLNAAAVPFFVIVAYAVAKIGSWTKSDAGKWILLVAIAVVTLISQMSVNAPVFASRYNFFHRESVP